MEMGDEYVHGYSERENSRLFDQAGALAQLLHCDSSYPAGSKILEAGCGVGAQTVILAPQSPKAEFTCIDISDESLQKAKKLAQKHKLKNVEFAQADIYNLTFPKQSFDHIFVCFVLEHLEDPLKALKGLKKVLKKGGSITVIEGDHGSAYFHPETREAHLVIQCLIDLQAALKGDSLIGRRLYPLMKQAGYWNVNVSPRMVYVDSGRPALVEGFTKNTFIAMVEGVKKQALAGKMVDKKTWQKGIDDLYRTTAPDGTFCYCFFKATAIR
jgi:ubiquinone/menaquinone biosynthesis C-methylase UbiE